LREFNGHRFAAFVVLHGDDSGLGRASFAISFESHTVIEFQRQRGKKDGEIRRGKFKRSRFAQLGAAAAKGAKAAATTTAMKCIFMRNKSFWRL